MTLRWAVVVATLAGCGRIGFDPLGQGIPGVTAHSTLRLDQYDAGEPLIDFPVAVLLGDTRIDSDYVQPDGSDLRFYDASGHILPMELEQAAPYIAWVRVPRIEGTTTTLTVRYGDPDAPRSLDPVWPDADAIWHFGAAMGPSDATSHHHDGVPFGNAASSDGFRGGGWDFPGASALVVGDTDWSPSTQLTLYGMIFMRTLPEPFSAIVTRENGADSRDDFYLGQRNGSFFSSITTSAQVSMNMGPVSTGTWHHLALTYDGATMRGYLDSQLVVMAAQTGTVPHSTGNPVLLGANRDNTDLTNQVATPDADFVDGVLDEVRIEHVARSGAWIAGTQITIGDGWITYGAIEYD